MTPAEVTLGVTTRRRNKEAHPGAVVKPRPYRSSATVKAELLAKANKAEKLTAVYKKNLAAIGSLENKMSDEDRQMDLDAARPPEKTRGNRYQSEDDDSEVPEAPSSSEDSSHVGKSFKPRTDPGEDPEADSNDNESSKGKPEDDSQEHMDEDEDDQGNMDEDEHEGERSMVGKKKTRVAKKGKREIRAAIERFRAEQRAEQSALASRPKRKAEDNLLAGAVPAKLISKKAKLSTPSLSASGLLPLWAKNRPESAAQPPKAPAISIAHDPFASLQVGNSGVESVDYTNDDREQQALTRTKPAPKHIRKKVSATKSDSDSEVVELPKFLAHVSRNTDQIDSESTARITKPKAVKFDNSHLPHGTSKKWREVLLPMWRDYMGQSRDPWLSASNGVNDAQLLYDKVFEHSGSTPQMLAADKEPIFSVLMQRTYEMRGTFAKAAVAAVAEFWASDPAFADAESAETRAAYVKWAVPQSSDPDEEVIIPFIWEHCDDSDPDHPKFTGAFRSQPILKTFGTHFMFLKSIPVKARRSGFPYGAMALSAVAVERAFLQWQTGTLVKETNGRSHKESSFSEANWGTKTSHYVASLRKTGPNRLSKMVTMAQNLLETKASSASMDMESVAGPSKTAGRALIFDDGDDTDCMHVILFPAESY